MPTRKKSAKKAVSKKATGKKATGKKAARTTRAAKAKAATKAKAAAKKPKAATKRKPTAKKKPAAKTKAGTKTKAATRAKPVTRTKGSASAPTTPRRPHKRPRVRRDATGHLNPAYAKDLRRLSRENAEHDDDRAFLVGERADDALAQELGTEFVETVTAGEDEGVELRDAPVPEETGGPFVTTTAGTELADEPDASNPIGATREPFPKT